MIHRAKKLEVISIAAVATLVLLALLPAGAASDTLFEDHFGSGYWANNWVDYIGPWRVELDPYYLNFWEDDADIESIDIDTTCYENITLNFSLKISYFESTDYFRVYYRTGGGTYQLLQNYTADQEWELETINLPPEAENVLDLQIQFWLDKDADDAPRAHLDDVVVTGDEIPGCCNRQRWDLSNTSSDANYTMYRTGYTSTGDVSVSVNHCYVWLANVSAATDVTFPAGTWKFRTARTDTNNDHCRVYIGVWNGSSFHDYGNVTIYEYPSTFTNYSISASSFTIYEGQYLALRICGLGPSTVVIDTSGDSTNRSYVTSPCTDPGYPYTELSTVCDCGDICVNTSGWWRNGSYFSASGTPIQAAVNTAAENETICVQNGTYDENVDVNVKNLTIKSQYGAAYTTVQALDIDDHVFYVTADYVNITGFTVLNATNSAGIMLWNDVDHCTILENTISNNSDGIALVESSHNNTLTNNTVSNNNYGIYLLNSSNNNITGNIVWNNTYYGIELCGSCNNNISCNWIHHNSKYGFYLHYIQTFPTPLGSSINNTIESNNIMSNGVEQEDDI